MRDIEYDFLKLLYEKEVFNREELYVAMKTIKPNITQASFNVKLKKMLDNEIIARIGRNAYSKCKNGIKKYTYDYSTMSKELVNIIKEKHPYLDFRVFELVQLNEFLNHQIAHNTTFISVEDDLGDFVFDTLKELYMGKLLINPTPEMYHQYWTNNMIVITKLLSEAPKGNTVKWETCIEKIMVDIFCDKLLESTYSSGEKLNIFISIFDKYVVDESKLFRYARRRGVEKKFRAFIKNEANVELRLEK